MHSETLEIARKKASGSYYERILKEGFFLRFKEKQIEKTYCAQIFTQRKIQMRHLIGTILVICLLFSLVDFLSLPHYIALSISLTRITPVLLCILVWLLFSDWLKSEKSLSALSSVYITVSAITLIYSQWIAYPLGVERPYVTLLLVILYTQILSPLPWRLGAIPTLACAIMLISSEWIYQTDENLLDLHMTYIGIATICALYSSYIYEHIARLNFISNARLQELGRHDNLTRLPNRREMDERLERLLRQAIREKTAIAIAMIDIDHFKAYNDHYGHPAGDRTLHAVAKSIQTRATLKPDFVARYGGEEFIAVWLNPQVTAAELGESLRQAVARLALPHQKSPTAHISISVGVSCHFPTSKSTIEQWLLSADNALYRAKENGRNCVRIDNSPQLSTPRKTSRNWLSNNLQPALSNLRENKKNKKTVRFRGIHERKQIESIAMLGIAITVSLMVVNYYSLPPEIAKILVWNVQGFVLLPIFFLGYVLSQKTWILRRLHVMVPVFCLITGMAYNAVFYYAQSHGFFISCEIILIVLFLVYAVGGQSWQSATLSGLSISIVFIWIQYNYPQADNLKHHMLIAILCVNLLGIISSRTHDKVALSAFSQREELESLATLDTLTGLPNRHGLNNYFKSILSLQNANRHKIAIAMMDVDHFKAYNDFYGHNAGDEVLARIGHELNKIATRPYDFAARYGGEEFVLVWYQPQRGSPKTMAERIRSQIAALNMRHEASQNGKVTISIGITQGAIQDGMHNIEQLLKIADQALYNAKNKGRNRVEILTQAHVPQNTPSAALVRH